jgi:hypothetical protein
MPTSTMYLADTFCFVEIQHLLAVARGPHDDDILLRMIDTLDQTPGGTFAIRVCKPRWRCSLLPRRSYCRGLIERRERIRYVLN